jgi:hypothetical protein
MSNRASCDMPLRAAMPSTDRRPMTPKPRRRDAVWRTKSEPDAHDLVADALTRALDPCLQTL